MKTKKTVKAFFSSRGAKEDPQFQSSFASYLAVEFSREELLRIYAGFKAGEGRFDYLMRSALAKSILRKAGKGLIISPGVSFIHPETIELGDGVFIGTNTVIQGRGEGRCIIGNNVWIGPQSYFDARDLIVGDNVGWGPGAKVLGAEHTGLPVEVPVISTDLIIETVMIGKNCDIGVNVVVMPGVTIGEGTVIGAGAVVTKDIGSYSVAAGVPARILRKRN